MPKWSFGKDVCMNLYLVWVYLTWHNYKSVFDKRKMRWHTYLYFYCILFYYFAKLYTFWVFFLSVYFHLLLFCFPAQAVKRTSFSVRWAVGVPLHVPRASTPLFHPSLPPQRGLPHLPPAVAVVAVWSPPSTTRLTGLPTTLEKKAGKRSLRSRICLKRSSWILWISRRGKNVSGFTCIFSIL